MSLYRQQYDAARSMFDETDTEPCIREAKKNFKSGCLKDATRKNDAASLDGLKGLQKELDQLQEFKVDDLTGLTKAQRQMFDNEEVQLNPSFQFFLALQNMDPDITEDEQSDEDSNTAAENEMELATEKSGDEHAVAAAEHEMELVAEKFEAEHEVAAAEDEMEAVADYMQLPAISVLPSRPKTANHGKGGSYHAQRFSTSLGEGSKPSGQANMLDMDRKA